MPWSKRCLVTLRGQQASEFMVLDSAAFLSPFERYELESYEIFAKTMLNALVEKVFGTSPREATLWLDRIGLGRVSFTL